MPVHFLPVQEPDFPALTRLFLEAFEKDPLLGRLKSDLPEPVRYEETLKYFLLLWGQRNLYGGRFWKAVEFDEDGGGGGEEGRVGKIVGFARWQHPHYLTDEQLAAKTAEQLREKKHPEGMNVPFYDEFYGRLREGRQRWIDHEKTYFLQLLAVLPSHHRRGIGSHLISLGLAAADRDNAKAYIEATYAGLPLYIRHGWVPVEEMRIDLDKFGYLDQGVCVHTMMIREPRGREKGEGRGDGMEKGEGGEEEE